MILSFQRAAITSQWVNGAANYKLRAVKQPFKVTRNLAIKN